MWIVRSGFKMEGEGKGVGISYGVSSSIHWGFPQCLFILFIHSFGVHKIEIKCLFVRILFCYDFKKLDI